MQRSAPATNTEHQTAALLEAAPLANPNDLQARATVEAMLRDPHTTGVGLDVLRQFVDAMLPDGKKEKGAYEAAFTSTGGSRRRALPYRARVPVAPPYVVSFEELAARANWTCFGPQKCASAGEALAAIGARTREAERMAGQVSQCVPGCDQQRSRTMRPMAIPDTPWGECARRVHWERVRAESAILRQQRTTVPRPRTPAAAVGRVTASATPQ